MWIWTIVLGGCVPDDWDGQPYVPDGVALDTGADTAASTADPTAIVGRWRSEGDDLSPLFAGAPFSYVQVDVQFEADARYTATSTDGGGTTVVLSGTYTADRQSTPGVVVLSQSEPYEASATGLWQVEGDLLTYEVVQTLPDYGFAPPTPEAGFGSTSGPGMDAGINVQRYRRQP